MEISEYIEARLKIEQYEKQLRGKYVKPFTCACCQQAEIKPLCWSPEEGNSDVPSNAQEDGTWNDGAVVVLNLGYGSRHDMESYYMAVCDNCITKLAKMDVIRDKRIIDRDYWKDTSGAWNEHLRSKADQ